MKTTLTVILILSFSVSSLAQLDSSIIPVRLSYFEASSNATGTTLRWKSVCYLEYANFEILRSTDGTTFTPINDFTADRIRCQDPFDYTDNNISSTGQLLYKINVKGIDGKAYQSKIIAVFTKGKGIVINSFSPTLVTTSATISISSASSETIQLSVINMQGRIVKQQKVSLTKGASTHELNLAELQKGQYQAVFQQEGGEKKVISFIRQ